MRQTYTDDSKKNVQYAKAYRRSMGARKYPARKTTMPNNRPRHEVSGTALPIQRGNRVTQKEMYGDKNAWNISAEVGLNNFRPQRQEALSYARPSLVQKNDGNWVSVGKKRKK